MTSSLVIGRRRLVTRVVAAGSLGGRDAGGSSTPATTADRFRMISLGENAMNTSAGTDRRAVLGWLVRVHPSFNRRKCHSGVAIPI